MNIINLINTLGDDISLLTRSDEWLEVERRSVAQRMDMLAEELRSLMLAQRIKSQLQQKNIVPVQQFERSVDGKISNISIHLMKLPDALLALKQSEDPIDETNRVLQLNNWLHDGYDLETAATMRPDFSI